MDKIQKKMERDYTISFFAGILGGLTVLIFSYSAKALIDGLYFDAAKWFGLYVIAGVLVYTIGLFFVRRLYVLHKIKKSPKKSNPQREGWFKKRFTFKRFVKAFLLSVTIGLGAYLGQIFLQSHWLLALIFVTLLLMLFAGNLLDVLYPWD